MLLPALVQQVKSLICLSLSNLPFNNLKPDHLQNWGKRSPFSLTISLETRFLMLEYALYYIIRK